MQAQIRVVRAMAGLALALVASVAGAQSYPSRVVKLVVPFPAGTSPDAIARLWADKLSKDVGQAVIVDNKPGAATIIGAQSAATAPPDGYTLLVTAQNTMAINPYVYKSLPYKADDFVPVSRIATVPLILIVAANSPIKSMAELMQAAKANPDKLNFASYGIGQGTHVAMVRLSNLAGMKMTHVPYKDGGILDVMNGAVTVSFEAATSALPQIRAGKLRALAVSSEKRIEALPDVPTVAETYPGFVADSWIGVFAIKGTPPDVVAKVSAESLKILDQPDYKARIRELGLSPGGGSPTDFVRFIGDDSRAWAKVVKDNDIKVD